MVSAKEDVMRRFDWLATFHWAIALVLASSASLPSFAQSSLPALRGPEPSLPTNAPPNPATGQLVVDVIVNGNEYTKDYDVQKYIHTRKDREFDPEILQADVRRLTTSGLFREVKPGTQAVVGGVVVVFEVQERARVGKIKILGNRGLSDKKLLKEVGVKPGDPLNTYAAEEGRRKIEDLYQREGYPHSNVSLAEGSRLQDRDLVYVVNEGNLQRISSVAFEGNTIALDGVLKTKISSKPGYAWYFFGGKVDRDKIEEDVEKLTGYYRSLGYFRARVSRELDYNDDGEWLTLKFIIDEGPRYKVRNVSVDGNRKFATQPVLDFLDMQPGDYFNQAEMNRDLNTLTDIYGSQGHVFADVQADPRFLEEPGLLDLVYRIKEGDVFSVGEVNVHIAGEFPHTRQTTILNRLSLRPGDPIDSRELRNSERRLKASNLFAGAQNDGEPPRIQVRPPELADVESSSPPPRSRR